MAHGSQIGFCMKPPTLDADRLALERTLLANERTLLAYVRTAMTLIVGGASLARFVPGMLAAAGGWALIVLGAMGFVVGARRFLVLRRYLKGEFP
jgi:putative membrane protein